MKTTQHENARNLYLQTSLSKTQIAELLGISRTTIYNWANQGNWERLRKSAQHMPAIISEKLYYVLGHLADNLLSEHRVMKPCTRSEAETIYKLTLSINKLKNRATLNESMEAFQSLLDQVKHTDPKLAEQIAPHMSEYFTRQSSIYSYTHAPANFNSMGFTPIPSINEDDSRLDLEERFRMEQEQHDAMYPPYTEEQAAAADAEAAANGQAEMTDEEKEAAIKAYFQQQDQEEQSTPQEVISYETYLRQHGTPEQIQNAIEMGLFPSTNPDSQNRAA